MAGIPHDKFEPKPGFQTWLNKRLPILSLAYDTLMIPTPKNLGKGTVTTGTCRGMGAMLRGGKFTIS